MQELSSESLLRRVWEVMDGNWNKAGYTAPNPDVYPYLWLWDSCFHTLIWAKLGEVLGEARERVWLELESIFKPQDELGFVPHINYLAKPNRRFSKWARRWGRTHSSAISQPPMYGHAIAELHRRGSFAEQESSKAGVPSEIIAKAVRGLEFFLKHRRRDLKSGLLYLCHPWESGMDDSPRWDDYCSPNKKKSEKNGGYRKKLELLKSLEFSSCGSPLYNPAFPVVSAGFNALVAFNALELAEVTGEMKLKSEALQISEALEERFSPELQTWVDGETPASRARTLDSLLPGLLPNSSTSSISSISQEKTPENRGLELVTSQLRDPLAFGGEYGPPSVHRQEPSFQGGTYWRGSSWPQMTYLFWIMTRQAEQAEATYKENIYSDTLAAALLKGVTKSGFAEHWDADTGEGLGAIPQSWASLALLVQA